MQSSKILLFLVLVFSTIIAACATAPKPMVAETKNIIFVCEHGNVKSLMAASYFNQLAKSNNLPYHALSRATVPDSKTVPPSISKGLSAEGIDVSSFEPTGISSSDITSAQLIITIGVSLPENLQGNTVPVEKWNDIPPASVDFNASSNSIKLHLQTLINQLGQAKD